MIEDHPKMELNSVIGKEEHFNCVFGKMELWETYNESVMFDFYYYAIVLKHQPVFIQTNLYEAFTNKQPVVHNSITRVKSGWRKNFMTWGPSLSRGLKEQISVCSKAKSRTWKKACSLLSRIPFFMVPNRWV